MAVKNKLKNQVVNEAKITGDVAYPIDPKIATAIDSRMIIFPKNSDGVRVIKKNTMGMTLTTSKVNSIPKTFNASAY